MKLFAQLNIFHNGLKPETKMILDATAGGTMMVVDVEQAKRIIDTLASTDYQAQYDRQSVPKKGVFELNTIDAILAQNKILTQQMKALTQKMAKLPQQLEAVQVAQPVTYQNPPLCYEFYGGNHLNGNCLQQNVGGEEVKYMGVPGRQAGQQMNYLNNPPTGWKNNMNQNWGCKQDAGDVGRQPMYQEQPQQQYPSLQDRTSKLEDILEKFMQATLTHQKNQEAFMRNLETQVGQLAKQMADQQRGQFSANTQTNPKEQCKAITIQCGKKDGSDVNEEADENRAKKKNC